MERNIHLVGERELSGFLPSVFFLTRQLLSQVVSFHKSTFSHVASFRTVDDKVAHLAHVRKCDYSPRTPLFSDS